MNADVDITRLSPRTRRTEVRFLSGVSPVPTRSALQPTMQPTQQSRHGNKHKLTVKITDVVIDDYHWIDLCDELGLNPIGSGLRHAPGNAGEASCSTYINEDQSLVLETITSIPDGQDDTESPDDQRGIRTTTVAFTGTHDLVDRACKTLFDLCEEAELDDDNPIQYSI